jgi:hypothetical protein
MGVMADRMHAHAATASLAGIRAGSAAFVAFPEACFRASSGGLTKAASTKDAVCLTVAGAAQAGLSPERMDVGSCFPLNCGA